MIDRDGEPVLLEFGLAREMDSHTLTLAGDVFGTLAYMAPEQSSLASRELDRRVDVYALGATLYECLTLRRAHEAEPHEKLTWSIMHEPVPDARDTNPALSRELPAVLETALARDRGTRYATALEFADDLLRVQRFEPIQAQPVSLGRRLGRWMQRNPRLAAALLLAALTLTIAIATASYLVASNAGRRRATALHLATLADKLADRSPVVALKLAVPPRASSAAPPAMTHCRGHASR